MRRHDIRLSTGADNPPVVFEFLEPTERTTLSKLQPLDWVWWDDEVQQVYDVRPDHYGVEVRLGRGTLWEPKFRGTPKDEIIRCVPQTIADVEARWVDPTLPAPETALLPWRLDGDTRLVLEFTEGWLRQPQFAVDYHQAGPSGLTGDYDIVARIGGRKYTERVVHGTLMVTRSAAAAVVLAPNTAQSPLIGSGVG